MELFILCIGGVSVCITTVDGINFTNHFGSPKKELLPSVLGLPSMMTTSLAPGGFTVP